MKLKEYREELKYKMRKTPKLISEFEKLVGLYIGNNKNIDEINDKEIKRTIKDRTDSFTGNGLFFHNNKVICIYEKSTSSFSKIENIIKNDIINKNDLFEFIKKMEEKSLSSSFTGIDRILLKKHGYDNFINYFKDKYYKEKKVIKP